MSLEQAQILASKLQNRFGRMVAYYHFVYAMGTNFQTVSTKKTIFLIGPLEL
jgi:hypothetical protein